jgi:hypothetical protein
LRESITSKHIFNTVRLVQKRSFFTHPLSPPFGWVAQLCLRNDTKGCRILRVFGFSEEWDSMVFPSRHQRREISAISWAEMVILIPPFAAKLKKKERASQQRMGHPRVS